MDESLRIESEKLRQSWLRHDAAMLRDYLVADVEDPRLNVQSILTRHFLLRSLSGDRFHELMQHELRFAVALNWLLRLRKAGLDRADGEVLLHGLRHGSDDAEGIAIPSYVGRVFTALPVSMHSLTVTNYLEAELVRELGTGQPRPLEESTLGLFASLWRRLLADLPRHDPLPRVLEAACGSANDYRVFEACGLGRLIDYSGFDLCETNVRNARALFPAARFEVGNVFEITAPDRSFDYAVAHDLFEHLSPAGLERAAGEICRVTRRALCLGFFSIGEIPDHLVRPVGDYHWNTLSLDRVKNLFATHGFHAQAIHIGTFLKRTLDCEDTHNPNAYTLILRPMAGDSSWQQPSGETGSNQV